MESWVVAQLAEIYATQAKIEGMKAANAERESQGHALAYGEESFVEAAQRLWGISNHILTNR